MERNVSNILTLTAI